MKTIKVRSIDQERWFIRRQQCNCGGRFEEELQQALLGDQNGQPVDRIIMKCGKCGAITIFNFDISSCAPHLDHESMKRLDAYEKVMTTEEAIRLVLTPMMDRVLDFIKELQQTGDVDAIEFIAEAAAHALQKNR